MKSPVRPELTTASVVRRQATPAAVDNSAPLQTRPWKLSIGVDLFKSTEPLLINLVLNEQSKLRYQLMKRLFDLALVLILGIMLFVPFMLIALAICVTSRGPVIYWSVRIGENNSLFNMPKFRSLITEAPVLATNLLEDPSKWLSPIGSFLRKSSLDELPQLWSILLGTMSFVGPRPALFNQKDLIELRTKVGVHTLKPGLTGWAQVNGRDEITIIQKVKYDAEYLERKSFIFDLYILWLTVLRVMKSDGVSH